ncbi:MAG: hypothetical protein HRU09_16995 [Oligoflexales bacterium]|nr:hypothetical protein [Oligoflexales bacterium]
MAFWSAGRASETLGLSLTVVFIWSFFTSCGSPDSKVNSSLEWSQSRPNDPNYAYLHQEDLEDTFYLGMSVTATSGFDSNALNMMVQPIAVNLFLEQQDQQTRLRVKSKNEKGLFETLLSFDVAPNKKYWEIDFASSGNDVEFNQLVQSVGGVYTAMDQKGRWISQGPPRVLSISQDPDTVVIDLQYTVKQVMVETDATGKVQVVPVSEKPGKVTVRMWLKRQKSAPSFSDFRTVGQEKKQSIGYFGSSFVPDPAKEDMTPIQRFAGVDMAKGKKVTFYLNRSFHQKMSFRL